MTDNVEAGATSVDVQGIRTEAVTRWLVENAGPVKAPFTFDLIAGGHSNLTYRAVDSDGQALVLRRPPLGHVLESAHDMGREHRIISALANSGVPVAGTRGMCADVDINGAPFYVMEFVDGQVMHDSAATGAMSAAERSSLGMHIIDVLADLHLVDVDGVGLGELGRKEAYLSRQLRRWTKQWLDTKTHEVPEMDEATRLIQERMPEQIGFAIVHGDYRPGNFMVGGGKLRAVLDWELCTLGDPLADVGYLLNAWHEPGEVELTGEGDGVPTAVGDFPTRAQISDRYAQRTGRDLTQINYYRAFSHWRLGAIGQGVYKRYLVGAMGTDRDVDLDKQKQSVTDRSIAALELLS